MCAVNYRILGVLKNMSGTANPIIVNAGNLKFLLDAIRYNLAEIC